jgi:hypothetical protein
MKSWRMASYRTIVVGTPASISRRA